MGGAEEKLVRARWRVTGMDGQIHVIERIKAKCFFFHLVPCLMSDLPPNSHNGLTVSDSLPLHPVLLYCPVWECSCAVAAILHYIGQWEIV